MALEKVFPWVTSNHFAIRLTAQHVLCRIYHSSPLNVKESQFLKAMVSFIETNEEVQKKLEKCREYYFFSKFDPVEDLNLEFLFRGVFTVLDLEPEEKISCVSKL
jgi:hypothetical protein